MSDLAETSVTGDNDGVDIEARIASLTQRVVANPDKIGLRLRLAHLLDQSGRYDEALRMLGEAVGRFPRNGVAKARFEALRDRGAVAPALPEPALADAIQARQAERVSEPAPVFVAEHAPPAYAPERRFVAQDELLKLARMAQGRPANDPAVAADLPPAMARPAAAHPAELQAEPSLRLRLNPLNPRYRAEIYFAASLIAVIVLSGVVVWRWPHTGLLIDHGTVTPIVLAPRPPDPAVAPTSPEPVTLPPASVPVPAARIEPDSLAMPPSLSVAAAPPDAPPAASAPTLPLLPEQTALPNVSLDVPAGDAQAVRMAADLTARLQRAGVAVHPEMRAATRQDAGITYFFAEDAALARTVASVLGQTEDQVRQARLPPGVDVLPGAIRVTLPATPRPRRPG